MEPSYHEGWRVPGHDFAICRVLMLDPEDDRITLRMVRDRCGPDAERRCREEMARRRAERHAAVKTFLTAFHCSGSVAAAANGVLGDTGAN